MPCNLPTLESCVSSSKGCEPVATEGTEALTGDEDEFISCGYPVGECVKSCWSLVMSNTEIKNEVEISVLKFFIK